MKHTALTTESFAAIFGWARFTGTGYFGMQKKRRREIEQMGACRQD